MLIGRPDLDFKLSITRALADQLDESLRRCAPAPLVTPELNELARRPGVYELLVDGELVYIGKASKSLPERLAQHAKKLSGREGFEAADVRFVCLYVDEDLEASAPEKLLIKRYRPPWNNNGFGNKDPGRRRDKSAVAANHFDARYPVNLDYLVQLPPGPARVTDVLPTLKARLPYLLRYANPKKDGAARAAYAAAHLVVPERPIPARDAMALVVSALPDTWQATVLPGYVILYPDNPEDYGSAVVYVRSRGDGTVEQVPGPQRLGPERDLSDVGDDEDGEADGVEDE